MLRSLTVLALTATHAVMASGAPTHTFDSVIDAPESFWQQPRDTWLKGPTASWFRGVTDTPTGDLRYPGYSNSPVLTFLGFRVYEIVMHYGSGSLDEATVSLYNRGDAGEIPQAAFTAKVAAIQRALSARFGRRRREPQVIPCRHCQVHRPGHSAGLVRYAGNRQGSGHSPSRGGAHAHHLRIQQARRHTALYGLVGRGTRT